MLPVLGARVHGAGAGVGTGTGPVSVTSTGMGMGEAVGRYHTWIIRSMLKRADADGVDH